MYLGEKQHDDPEFVTDSHHQMLWSLLGRYVRLVSLPKFILMPQTVTQISRVLCLFP